MNRESSLVTAIRKHTPSKKQYQKRSDKTNTKITELEKNVSKANFRECLVGKATKGFKTSKFNDKKKTPSLQNKLTGNNKKECFSILVWSKC